MIGDIFDFRVPFGFQLLRFLPFPHLTRERKLLLHRIFILVLTYAAYVCYHASRKPISVVKNELINCTAKINATDDSETKCSSWITEMDGEDVQTAQSLEGVLDSTYLFSYAFFMFFSGIVAERVNLRYYLSLGMIFSGIFTFLFGLARYTETHGIAYFIVIQFFGGAFQTTGWPSVVTVVANWFGKGKKGLIFGIWNSHTSVGNILGSFLAGYFVSDNWGLSFIVPGILIAGCGFIIWLFMIVKPEDVGIDLESENPQIDTEQSPRDRRASSSSNSRFQQNRSNPIRSNVNRSHSGESTPLLQSEESDDDNSPREKPMEEKPKVVITSSTADLVGNESGSTEDGLPLHPHEEHAISFLGALRIPGVIEFSLCLFFAKLVSYVFLFWLPTFIKDTGVDGITSEDAAYFSILFDVGGIVGGIIAGMATDFTGKSATTCSVMLVGAIPLLFSYQSFGHNCPLDVHEHNSCYYGNVGLLMLTGLLVNGPYALITTAVSAELGTHPSLQGSSKALATVTSVIDGTGSIGAAVGPFLAGAIGVENVFYMLMASDVLALVFLLRLVKSDIIKILEARRQRRRGEMYSRHS